MKDKYLPIGSVVILKGATKKIMITGYCMQTKEEPGKIYDYNGCPFPEGVLKTNMTSVFNHDQIQKIFHEGYKDETTEKFFTNLKKELEKNNNIKKEN